MARRRLSALNAVAECARSPHLAAAAQSRLPEQAGKDDPGHPGQPTGMVKQILVLCVGNICRRPTAENRLRRLPVAHSVRLTYAGLGALVGHPIEGHAMELLHEHGMDATQHRARQVYAEMLRAADLVLGMERRHLLSAAPLAT